ncbi:MAG: NAD(P)H-dependent glycerol-3-phosphate dehydrogenase [Lachnospiraceae bacterium]
MAKISVLGAGSWGTALALLLNNNGHDVTIWSILPQEIEQLKVAHENTRCLPGVKIPESITLTADASLATSDKDVLVMAVASPYVRKTAHHLKDYIKDGQIIVNVAKGIEEETLMTLTAVIEEEIPCANVTVLSGPSHAEEVGRGLPTTCVVGAKDRETAEYLQNIFMSEVFRVYTSPDIIGIELGGALKNVIALAAGIADGIGYGDNTKAALITRGMYEIAKLGIAMGGKLETFTGLTGIGDLIVTCASMHSRNRRAGILIGQGKSYEEAMKEVNMVVEGVYAAKAAKKLSEKYNVDLPIVNEVNKILFEGSKPEEAVKELMLRDKKLESQNHEWNQI